jgi:heat shock protein HslJ
MRDHSLRSPGFGLAIIAATLALVFNVQTHAQDAAGATAASAPRPNAPPVNTDALLNVRWVLMQLGSVELPKHKGTREPYMTLASPPGRLEGFSGCNRMFGAYALDGARLTFGPGIGMTRMACAGRGAMELESGFAQALQATARWRVDGTSLELLDETGAVLARFTSTKPAAAR